MGLTYHHGIFINIILSFWVADSFFLWVGF